MDEPEAWAARTVFDLIKAAHRGAEEHTAARARVFAELEAMKPWQRVQRLDLLVAFLAKSCDQLIGLAPQATGRDPAEVLKAAEKLASDPRGE